ncbi:MAG TPA: hypothetical protein VG320_06060 [Paraburkholderia sp.]|jgi:hypothetical protein|uniref:hypothetical protein n=1 Tax=Paraburkholderia sp. TaxID=1926495 RepID=UPI002DF51500|nr:hypothetical protein [Paraburkholderia sp.]
MMQRRRTRYGEQTAARRRIARWSVAVCAAVALAYAAWIALDMMRASAVVQAADAVSAASDVRAKAVASASNSQSVQAATVATATTVAAGDHPPIGIHFSLAQPGYVTLVIETTDGRRVRNLISETPFPAGDNTAWWDGLDDLGRDPDAAAHGQYRIPGRLVAPGTYRVRGLVRPALKALYEFNPYDPGRPPWKTAQRDSDWLANHAAPSAVLFVPGGATGAAHAGPDGAVLVGSYVTEGGSGLAWLDMQGKKRWGQTWMGGVWTGATQLARDTAPHAASGVYAYAATSWRGDQPGDHYSELRLNALMTAGAQQKAPADARLGTGEDIAVITPAYRIDEPADTVKPAIDDPYPERHAAVSGLAAHDGLVVVSLRALNQLLFVDAARHRVVQRTPLADPRGLAFDAQGHLLALSGARLVRLDANLDSNGQLHISPPQDVIAAGLEDPQALCVDQSGAIYVSDWGKSHQVKVFDAAGKLLRAIGHAGAPAVGLYDPQHMNHPAGISLDGSGRLWVAENDKTPKRVSVWDAASGRLVNAFYGPPRYGGGGTLDPRDRTRFYYADEAGGLAFKLDWTHGVGVPSAITYRADSDDLGLSGSDTGGMPDYPLYRGTERYLTNAHSAQVTGRPSAIIWHLGADGVAHPAAAAGSTFDSAGKLLPAFNTDAMRARMPAGSDPQHRALLFLWRDANGDGRMSPDEVTFWQPQGEARGNAAMLGNVTVLDDLSFAIAYAGSAAVMVPATSLGARGVPVYDVAHAKTLATNVQAPVSTGGAQMLVARDGWTIFTTPPAPFAPQGVSGLHAGGAAWSYPSLWPGLHASHAAPVPAKPGELIGTTRVLGNPFDAPTPSDAGQLWAINGNEGSVYLFTTDGLFVATLFKDTRLDTAPPPPEATRGLDLAATSLGPECFHPTIVRADDGNVYMQAGSTAPLLRIVGLEGVRRLPDQQISLSAQQLVDAQREARDSAARIAGAGAVNTVLNVAIHAEAGAQNWPDSATQWASIDTRSVQVGDWGHQDSETKAALAIFADRLYIAVSTDTPTLLDNSGEALQNLFATGGGIDLMLGANADADPNRSNAVQGDERLVVSRVHDMTKAMLFRPVAAPDGLAPITYSSPLRTIHFDRVDEVSDKVDVSIEPQQAAGGQQAMPGVLYKISVPLSVLGLNATAGRTLAGDIGVLRGNGFQTLQRAYWSNKAGGLVSDLPGEAELTPNLWGKLRFVDTASQ